MPNLRKFCACGDEYIGTNLTPAQIVDALEQWNRAHDKPGCYAVNARAAKKKRQNDFLDEIFGKEDK